MLYLCRGRAGDRSANGQSSGWDGQGVASPPCMSWVSTVRVTTREGPFLRRVGSHAVKGACWG